MKGIWGKNLSEEMNLTLAFVLDLGEQKKGRMNVAGASCFRVYADGKLIGFGPPARRARLCPHGGISVFRAVCRRGGGELLCADLLLGKAEALFCLRTHLRGRRLL